MSDKVIQDFGNQYCKEKVPVLKPGYQVKVHQKIKEGNKERVQVFQGVVIKVNSGNGVNSNFTVRKVSDGIGIEKTYPIHSPNIVKIEVQRAHKVRRAKLNYLRDLSGKALRLKEVPLNLQEWERPELTEAVVEEPKEETAPVAEEAAVEEKSEEPAKEEVKAEEEKKEEPKAEETPAEESDSADATSDKKEEKKEA